MWYMPFVRVRRAVTIYAFLAIGISLVAVAIRFWPGVITHHGQAVDLSGIRVSLGMLLTGAAALVGGFATVLGLNLAAENDGHLELAWSKPVSREGYALGVFAVDIAAMIACIVLTIVCGALVVDIFVGHQAIELDADGSLGRALAFCGFPLCMYAWIAALSVSLKRNRGTVAGIFWPVMLVVGLLRVIPVPAVHTIALALNTVNPLVLYTESSGAAHSSVATLLFGWLLAAVLLAAAVGQWRRLEI